MVFARYYKNTEQTSIDRRRKQRKIEVYREMGLVSGTLRGMNLICDALAEINSPLGAR